MQVSAVSGTNVVKDDFPFILAVLQKAEMPLSTLKSHQGITDYIPILGLSMQRVSTLLPTLVGYPLRAAEPTDDSSSNCNFFLINLRFPRF